MPSYLITGCSRGIEASTIFAAARKESPALKSLIEKSSGKVIFVSLEVTDSASTKRAVAAVEKSLDGKGVDILINNAGIVDYTPKGPSSLAAEELNRVLNTNVTGVHSVTRAFVPLMENSAIKKIVNISSTMGSIAMVEGYLQSPSPAYKISKAAVNMLSVQYAFELGKRGFTVFSLSPGWLKTDLGGKDYADLEVNVGAKATLDKIFAATKEDNGKFLNIRVEGYENVEGPNKYDGRNSPW